MKKLYKKLRDYLTELGTLTPIALITALLPFVGSAVLITFSSPISSWFKENLFIGSFFYLIFVVFFCGMSLLPTNVIGVICGWAFGFWSGLFLHMLAVVGAASLSFLIHRRIAGERLTHVFEHHPKANAIYNALIKRSFWRTTLLICLLRLSPAMPFALTNFMMTSARVPYSSYAIGTLVGMLPRSAAVVFFGSGLDVLDFDNPNDFWILIFGIIATIISIIFVGKISKHALLRMTKEDQNTESAQVLKFPR